MTHWHKYGVDDAIVDVYKKLVAADTENIIGQIDQWNREINDDEDPEVFTIINGLGTRPGQVVDRWIVNINVYLKLLPGAGMPSGKLTPIKNLIVPIFDDTNDGVTSYEIDSDQVFMQGSDKAGFAMYNFRVIIFKT